MEWPKDRVAAGMKYVPEEIKRAYRKHYEASTFLPASVEIAYGLNIIRALHAAGAGLLAGSDAFKPNAVPGFALHEELNYFVQAGLMPYESLRAATSDAARFLGRENEFGTVQVGRRANLLLLSGNPLDDVNNLAKRIGVMARGRWFTEADLHQRLNSVTQAAAR